MNKSATACIVLPTYNEAGNVEKHLDAVFSQDLPVNLHVLVVDDNSPDGTAKIVQKYMKVNRNVHLLFRTEKEGLGAAYIAGMQHALDTINPDVVLEMDADGQHDPGELHKLINTVLNGADFVIGSRYVEGGSIPDSWSTQQKVKSWCANLTTRVLLGTGPIRDCSGGYRAIRSETLRHVDWDGLKVKGYAFQAVLLEEILFLKGIVREIPISFSDREIGESKMRLSDMLEGFAVFARIRLKRIFNRPTRRSRIRLAKT